MRKKYSHQRVPGQRSGAFGHEEVGGIMPIGRKGHFRQTIWRLKTKELRTLEKKISLFDYCYYLQLFGLTITCVYVGIVIGITKP